jgi:hypothetical protein
MVVSIAGTNSFASARLHHNAFYIAQLVVFSEFAVKAAANSHTFFDDKRGPRTLRSGDQHFGHCVPVSVSANSAIRCGSECPHTLQLIMNSFVPLILVDISRLEKYDTNKK